MRLCVLCLLIFLVLFSTNSRAQSPLSPQMIALLDYYFSSLGSSNSISTSMIADGAVTLVKVDEASLSAYFATNMPLYVEVDPWFAASPSFGITALLIGQWNAAYAWGDPAGFGYITGAQVPANETDPAWTAIGTKWSGVITCATDHVWFNQGSVTGVWNTGLGAWR